MDLLSFTEALNVDSVFFMWHQATVEMWHFLLQPEFGTGSLISLEQLVASKPTLA